MGSAPAAAPAPSAASGATSGGLESNVAAALGYIFIVAIIWLLVEPYNKDRFVRFHAFQSLAFGVSWFVITTVLAIIPVVGWLVLIMAVPAGFVLWFFCIYKAFNKEWFKIPFIGDWALQQAGGQ
ncbi:MAG TPA: DUF4870 domain-containing protein [Candidatus Acidoferrales bacterium]